MLVGVVVVSLVGLFVVNSVWWLVVVVRAPRVRPRWACIAPFVGNGWKMLVLTDAAVCVYRGSGDVASTTIPYEDIADAHLDRQGPGGGKVTDGVTVVRRDGMKLFVAFPYPVGWVRANRKRATVVCGEIRRRAGLPAAQAAGLG